MNKQTKIEKPSGKISIHGREYETVASRVQRFREAHPEYGLTTAIIDRDAECVVVQAMIVSDAGRLLATGHAEEYRKASQINRTSALENAETSAIGRALAALGFGGTEFATANEVQNAIHQQGEPQTGERDERPKVKPAEKEGDVAPSALGSSLKLLVHHIHGAGNMDELNEVLGDPESQIIIEQCKRRAPHWYETGNGMPEEFVPLKALIDERTTSLEAAEREAAFLRG